MSSYHKLSRCSGHILIQNVYTVHCIIITQVIEALVGVLKKLKRYMEKLVCGSVYSCTMMSSPHRMDVAQALSTKAFAMKNMTKLNNTVRGYTSIW